MGPAVDVSVYSCWYAMYIIASLTIIDIYHLVHEPEGSALRELCLECKLQIVGSLPEPGVIEVVVSTLFGMPHMCELTHIMSDARAKPDTELHRIRSVQICNASTHIQSVLYIVTCAS